MDLARGPLRVQTTEDKSKVPLLNAVALSSLLTLFRGGKPIVRKADPFFCRSHG